MATPKIIADFETQLATALAIGGTSFTLASATDDDGVALPNGLYYFTVDNATSNKEYLAGTLAGTSVTSVVSVSRQGVETSGAARAHRIGTPIIMTDFMTYKKYMDEIALVSAPDASTIAKGVTEEATQAEVDADTATGGTSARLFVNPSSLATSKYGTRLPSATEKEALAGGGAFGTPSTSNKYLTEEKGTVTIEEFTADGTWTKPDNTKAVEVIVIGAGGGGGGGESNSSLAGGGGGGGGGGISKAIFDGADIPSSVTVTVGTGGAGGAINNGGSNGESSSFGDLLKANGGGGGSDGGTGSAGGGGTGTIADGGAGGIGQTTSGVAAASTIQAPSGGGGGGGSNGSGTGGGAGGSITLLDIKTGPAGGAATLNGTAGVAATVTGAGGTGGGGGGGSATTGTSDAGHGANGGIPGGGGGGGGGYDTDASGGAAGPGGDGGRGVVYVISYS